MSRQTEEHHNGCLICGKPLVYSEKENLYRCSICHRSFFSQAACENGHFVCDDCHTASLPEFLRLLQNSRETDPVKLFSQIMALPGVHMHGPEHHSIVPGVLLVGFHNNGGDLDINEALKAAFKRGSQAPGGMCGYWGVCGAAAGASMYASVVMGSHPLNAKVWGYPQLLASRCLQRIANTGGPRCCKRNSVIALETAIDFTREYLGVDMPNSGFSCVYSARNKECLQQKCPYHQA